MTREKMVALGRAPLKGSVLQQWVNEGLRAKYPSSFPTSNDKISSQSSSSQKHSSSRSS
jgi:hypothetical protein